MHLNMPSQGPHSVTRNRWMKGPHIWIQYDLTFFDAMLIFKTTVCSQRKLNKVKTLASPLFHWGCGLFLCCWLVKYAGRSLISYLICWSIVTALHCPDQGKTDTYTYCINGLSFHRHEQSTQGSHTNAHSLFSTFSSYLETYSITPI